VKVVKNKVAPPFRVCEFDIMYNKGISAAGDLLDLALADKLIEKSGSWFNYGSMRLGQGRENVKEYLETHPELFAELRALILEKNLALSSAPTSGISPDLDDEEEIE
jgi:recombination protein RecA